MRAHRLIFGLLAVLVCGSAGAQDAPGSSPAGDPLGLSGRVSAVWGDPVPGSDGPPRQWLHLDTDAGQRWQLVLDEAVQAAAGGLTDLRGTRIEVTGSALAGREQTLQVASLRRVGGGGDPLTLFGSQPYIWLLLKFSDDPSEPHPPAWYIYQALGPYPSMNHYFSEISYGNIDLLGSNATVWLELPNPRSHYVYDFDPNHPGDDLHQANCLNDAILVADPVVDFSQYAGINLCFNGPLAGYAMGGWDELTLDGETRDWGLTWLGFYGWGAQSIVAHEMGHTFGWPHSCGDYGDEYDSHWDVMSRHCGVCTLEDPIWGLLPPGTIAYQKMRQGWIHPLHMYAMPFEPTVAAVHLNDLYVVPPVGRMLTGIVYHGATAYTFYTVERRRWTGYDEVIPDQTVLINNVNIFDPLPVKLVDPDLNGDPNDEGARWDLGETFADYNNGIVIHVYDVDFTGSVVIMSNEARVTTYVDENAAGYEDGSSGDPWNTPFEGYGAVYPGGSVRFDPDDYTIFGGFTFRKPARLERWGGSGTVTIRGSL